MQDLAHHFAVIVLVHHSFCLSLVRGLMLGSYAIPNCSSLVCGPGIGSYAIPNCSFSCLWARVRLDKAACTCDWQLSTHTDPIILLC